jgi:hypothetical protein
VVVVAVLEQLALRVLVVQAVVVTQLLVTAMLVRLIRAAVAVAVVTAQMEQGAMAAPVLSSSKFRLLITHHSQAV